MLTLVLAAALAAAPAPRGIQAADTVVHIPRLDALQGVNAFLERAGVHAALMRPAVWHAELHPFFPLEPGQPERLTALGVEPSGPVTVSMLGGGRLTCTRLADPKIFQARAGEVLATAGSEVEVKPRTSGGVTSVLVSRESGGQAGYALKGKEACAFLSVGAGFVDDGAGRALLKEATRLVSRKPKPDGRLSKVPGVLYVLQPRRGLVVGVDGSGSELRLEGLSEELPLPPFQAAGTSPYGAVKPAGLLVSRARVAPRGVAQAVGNVRARIQEVCPTCPPARVSAVARGVSEHLTGHVLLLVDSVKVRGSLRTTAARFFAPRQALAAEVTDAEAVKRALAPLKEFPGAKALEDGYALDVKGGTLFVRQEGRHLVVGNDESVTKLLLAALPQEGVTLPHAVDFTVDPRRLARGLSQVSLMDVVSDQELAGLFAVGLEMGPLLANSEQITGWLDSAPRGTHRFSLTWTLPAASP